MPKKTVLITGSSRGLGKSLALTFAGHGYSVILHGRDRARLNSVRREILKNGVDCSVIIGDIAKKSTIDKLTLCAKKLDIDILINNAAIFTNKLLEEITADEIKKIVDVNLVAPILLTKSVYGFFKKKGNGQIININSVAGKTFNMDESMYSAAKHGLRGFMTSFQFEAVKHNVSVMNVYPGAIDTDMIRRNNVQKLIKANEAAELIYLTSQNYSSVRTSEIDILRKIY
jgi:short-subunit dehydrogenase